MALPTFAPAVKPSPGTKLSPTLSLNEVQFGDGYTLQSPAGLNHIRHMLSLKWGGLTQSEHDDIIDFLRERGGYKPFYYTHDLDGVTRKWICKTWSSTLGVPLEITADFTENFSTTV